ncbi:17501_t:CDS:2, partial [Cetraspora pellucida]
LGFSRPAKEDLENSEFKIYGIMPFVAPEAYDADLMFNICGGSRPNITEDTPRCWATLMQKCWHSDLLKRPSINEIDREINSKIKPINSEYWKIDKNFIQAENKRQELLNSGKFIVRYMHPHSKTHSQLLNPTIDFMHSYLIQNLRTNSYQPIGQEVPNSQTNNLSVSDALKQIITLSDLSFNDMLIYEAGKALAKALNMDFTLKYLDL